MEFLRKNHLEVTLNAKKIQLFIQGVWCYSKRNTRDQNEEKYMIISPPLIQTTILFLDTYLCGRGEGILLFCKSHQRLQTYFFYTLAEL